MSCFSFLLYSLPGDLPGYEIIAAGSWLTLIMIQILNDPLERELLELICTTCNLYDVEMDRITRDDPLIGPDSPLGTDSLDALEIAVTVQQEYGVRMDSGNTARVVLASLATLAEYIKSNR